MFCSKELFTEELTTEELTTEELSTEELTTEELTTEELYIEDLYIDSHTLCLDGATTARVLCNIWEDTGQGDEEGVYDEDGGYEDGKGVYEYDKVPAEEGYEYDKVPVGGGKEYWRRNTVCGRGEEISPTSEVTAELYTNG